MSSGEKILSVINEDSEKNIAEIKSESEKKCREILDKGRAKAKEFENAAEKKKAELDARMMKSCRSRVELEKRNAILKTKRAEIDKAVAAVEEYVKSFNKPYTYMQLLRNFLLNTKKDSNGKLEIESLFMTIIENNRENETNN